MRPIKSLTLVNIPQGDTAALNLTFKTNTGDGSWKFQLNWDGVNWNGWSTMPDGTIRQFGCVPGVINWTGFLDFGLVWLSSLTALGQPDIFNASLVLIDWG